MGKLSAQARGTTKKLVEQQDNFSGGMNLTEENVNLQDDESRLIENLKISPKGSLSKRTGSVVLYDLGYTIKTLNGWFQEEKRPNPNFEEGNASEPEFIPGIFHTVSKEEYESFILNNKFLGHFTYESGETINHYIATYLGIFDQLGNRVSIQGLAADFESYIDVTNKYPLNPVEDFKWDWIVSVEEGGYYLHHFIWDEVEQTWNIEQENGEDKRYYIDKLGELYKGQVNFDDERWWPVSPEGVVTIRWMKDKDTPWDPKEPNKYKPNVPEAEIGFEDAIANISDSDNRKVEIGKSYFGFGGNDNRDIYNDIFPNNDSVDNIWWAANIKFSNEFLSQKLGHRLDASKQTHEIKAFNPQEVVIQSTQYKEETYIIMDGSIYTFQQGGSLKALRPYKPTFEEYNLLKGNLLGQRNMSFSQSRELNNQEALWNWDWTQVPQIADGNSRAIPMVLGIMGKLIPQSGRTLPLRAIAVDSRDITTEDEKNNGWKFIWHLSMESGLSSDEQLSVPLNQRPTAHTDLKNFLVPATNTSTVRLIGTLNSTVKNVPESIFPGLKLVKEHTDLFFLRVVAPGETSGATVFNWTGRYPRRHKLFMEHMKPGGGNNATFRIKDTTLYSKDSRRGDNYYSTFGGSGVKGFMYRVGLKFPAELVKEMFYGNGTAASLEKIVFAAKGSSALAELQFQSNNIMWSAGQFAGNGQIVAGTMAYLSFNQENMKREDPKWKKILNKYPDYNFSDDLHDTTTKEHRFTNSLYSASYSNQMNYDGRDYKAVGKIGGHDLDKTGNEKPFTIHGMEGLIASGKKDWKPNQKNVDISINNWPRDILIPWMNRYLVSPLPGANTHIINFDFWNQLNEQNKSTRTVRMLTNDMLKNVDFTADLKAMENEILGVEADDSDKDYLSPLGEPWTPDELNSEDIILNLCFVAHWIPHNYWGQDYSMNSKDESFWEYTGIDLKNAALTSEGGENLFLDGSYVQMAGGVSGDSKTFHVTFPIAPVNNIESFLPKMSSIMYINSINNSYIYKQQNFVWNTNSSIVFYSDVNNFSYFPVIQTLELVDFPDEQIQSMQVYGDTALFFTKNRIYQLRGSSVEDFQIQLVNESVGSINPNTVKSVGNSLYFMSRKGAYRLKKGYSAENYFLVEPIDTNIKGAYDPQTDTIHCTTEGEDYYIHILNRKETWIYNNITNVWTKNHYGITEEIRWFRNINNETYYVTDDFKICKMYNDSYRFLIDNRTTETDILDLQSLYLDQFNRDLLLDDNNRPLEGKEKYFKLDKNKVVLGFNTEELIKDNLGYPIVSTWKSKEWSGQGDKVHHQKKFKELQLKFTRDSYAVGGWYSMVVDGNAIIDPEYQAIEVVNGEYQIVTKRTDYIEEPRGKSTLTRNPGTHLSRSFKLASGEFSWQNSDNEEITWGEDGKPVTGETVESPINYQYPLSSLWENTSEANMRKKRGKKGYTMQAVLINDEQLPFGLKSCLLVYKLKKPK